MKTNNYTIDEMIESFQSMSVSELKQIEKDSELFLQNNGEYPEDEFLCNEQDNTIDELSDIIQNMSVYELKAMPTTKINADDLTIEQKVLITGLDKWIIVRLETQKENATLKEIMTYCEKLKIPLNRFIPELFSSIEITSR